jgi:Helicase HerA, central domain
MAEQEFNTFTIKLPQSTTWDGVRAERFVDQFLQTFPANVAFGIHAEQNYIEWQIHDFIGGKQDLIEAQILSLYPEAEVSVGVPKVSRSGDEPVYRYVSKYEYMNDVFLAPIKHAREIKDVDPLIGVTQVMGMLKEGEYISYMLYVASTSQAFYKEGEKLLTREVHGEGLWGLLNPQKVDRYVPAIQQVLADKLENTLLLQCVLWVQVESPHKERLEALLGLNSQLIHLDRPEFNGIRRVQENIQSHAVYVDKLELEVDSGLFGLMVEFLRGEKAKPEIQALRKKTRLVLEPREIAALWHLPHSAFTAPTIRWVKPSPPKELIGSRDGVQLGTGQYKGKGEPIYISDKARETHMMVIGRSGMGKSTFLHNLIHQDIAQGKGVAVLDPHGDLVRDVLRSSIPSARENDVIILDIANPDFPPPLNPLAVPENARQEATGGQELITILERVYGSMSGTPRLTNTLKMALSTLWQSTQPTVLDVERIFDDPVFRRKLVAKAPLAIKMVLSKFWKEFDERSDARQEDILSPIRTRMQTFYGNSTLLPMMCHPDTLDFEQIMMKKKILLVSLNVSDRKVSKLEKDFLGALIVSQLQMSAMGFPEGKRYPYYLYIDEAQRFVTSSLPEMFAEVRKRGLSLTLANQVLAQIPDKALDVVLGNVGALVTFGCSHEDARTMSPYMKPSFDAQDLVNLDKFTCAVWMKHNEKTLPAFLLSTEPPPHSSKTTDEREGYLRQLSIQRYTPKSRAEIEAWISKRYAGDDNAPDEPDEA